MSKIALIGPKYLVNPLSACGIDTTACETESQTRTALKNFVEAGEYSIIFMTERLAAEITDEIEAVEDEAINIVLLPDHRGSTGLFREKLESLMRKATGSIKI